MISHYKPINELLFPILKDQKSAFDNQFAGMTSVEFTYDDYLKTINQVSNVIKKKPFLRGNPSDNKLFIPALDSIIKNYGIVPRDCATDGGYASLVNHNHAKKEGITNIVFNKIVGSLKNISTSKNIETSLKKWRSGMEAVISNIKRGFNLRRCSWKGWEHFESKVLWSVLAYNIRVMTAHILKLA